MYLCFSPLSVQPTTTDKSTRQSVSQCLQATYLTSGIHPHTASYVPHGRSGPGDCTSECAGRPQLMDPLTLHTQPPLQLPLGNQQHAGGAADMVDQQWSRRQYSILWAPMPAEYDLGDDNDAADSKVSDPTRPISCVIVVVVVLTTCNQFFFVLCNLFLVHYPLVLVQSGSRRGHGSSGTAGGEHAHPSDIWLMTHAYTMASVAETYEEQMARFRC
jgi:hypothetical protein